MKSIHLWGVRQNNLKNIEVHVPLNKFVVICGPSGSGKSSLAFETLFAEGQRRFIESMSNYSRQFLNKAPKPDIEGVQNIPPAVAIEQKNRVRSARSTVGTTTEILDYLRLLFEKVATSECPKGHGPTKKFSATEAVKDALSRFNGKRGYIFFECENVDLKSLLADGFLRYLGKTNEVLELTAKTKLPKSGARIVVDRLSFDNESESRIYDSLLQAYEMNRKYSASAHTRKASAMTTEGEMLIYSEEPSCPVCQYTPPTPSSSLFSFNSPIGACPECKGFGNILVLDEAKVVPNPRLSIKDGALNPYEMPSAADDKKVLLNFCKREKIPIDTAWEYLNRAQKEAIWNGEKGFIGVLGLFDYLETLKYKMHVRIFISRYRSPSLCPTCQGQRLRGEVQYFRIGGSSITQLSSLNLRDLLAFIDCVKLSPQQTEVAGEIYLQLRSRLQFLNQVGVHYLSLDRETRTLSGGEYQRLLLANQLGMGLSQVLFVLDEPTVGLHPRDNHKLIQTLIHLKDGENTLVVVEHDPEVIKASDYVIEIGPGSGAKGGTVIFAGTTSEMLKSKDSVTAPYLISANSQKISRTIRPVDLSKGKYSIEIRGASGQNLKNIDVIFPLNRLVTVTGVSGSGKSTLVSKTLYPILARELGKEFIPSLPYKSASGLSNVRDVVLVDQSPVGRTGRSSPVTYLKVFDAIRSLMATVPESTFRGYTAGTFSMNVDGGRCPACKGAGYEVIDMQFMDNVILPCDVCDGKKYIKEVLEIQFCGKNIDEILHLTVAEALDFFVSHPNIRRPLSVLREVGLEYLQLGQPADTLSGGESQRLKIARELSQVSQNGTLYILDEPTTGLHFKEVQILLDVLQRLIEAGGSVVLVEHNLDVIRNSDYVIDLGPEAADQGGYIVASGTPESLRANNQSLTGKYLT